jgi:hypothetical protein
MQSLYPQNVRQDSVEEMRNHFYSSHQNFLKTEDDLLKKAASYRLMCGKFCIYAQFIYNYYLNIILQPTPENICTRPLTTTSLYSRRLKGCFIKVQFTSATLILERLVLLSSVWPNTHKIFTINRGAKIFGY